MFTKYGYSTLAIISVIILIIIIISFFIDVDVIRALLIIISLLFFVFTLNFFRDPERTPPDSDKIVVSPADGTVLFVKEITDNKFIKGHGKQISIFMSPLNVHVNRIPISGRIDYLQYFKGKYLAAFEDKASEVNERAEYGITSKFGKVFFAQVAGFIARRIVYEISVGDQVNIGERFGMIKFGSRVDIIVPEEWKAVAGKDDKVRAGETILFEYLKG